MLIIFKINHEVMN